MTAGPTSSSPPPAGPHGPVQIEVAVDSLSGAEAAARGGADRIELCAALELDGLTPTIGLLRQVRRCTTLPVLAMVRLRAGDFVYSRAEFEAMSDDAELLLANGAAGIVFGFLTADGLVDVERCREMIELVDARGQCVFHRAFDVVRDLVAALQQLIELGFTRVLTSGGGAPGMKLAPGLADVAAIARLVGCAAGRIEILAVGGIRGDNVAALIRATGVSQVHSSCRPPGGDTASAERVQALVAAAHLAR